MNNLDPINQIWLYYEDILKRHPAGQLSCERWLYLSNIVQLWYERASDNYGDEIPENDF
jgi:hypothetical protein